MNILPDLSMDSKQFDLYASVPDAGHLNRRTRSPGSRNNISAHEQFVPNRRSKTVDMYKDSEDSIDLDTHTKEASNPNNNTYSQSKENKKNSVI